MANLSQKSFLTGVVSPYLYGNTDFSKYSQALRTANNAYIRKDGGLANRPGSEFVAEVKDSTKNIRLIKFVHTALETYCLEFGDFYLRIHKNGVQIKNSAKDIFDIYNETAQTVVFSTAHGYSNGDEIYISGVIGMPEINNRWFYVSDVHTNSFKIKDRNGNYISTIGYGSYVSGGTAEKVYQVTTPWPHTVVDQLDYSQSGDIMTIVHPSYRPYEIIKYADTNWVCKMIPFGAAAVHPFSITKSGHSGTSCPSYMVTAVDAITGEESLAGSVQILTITNITKADPGIITLSAGTSTSQLRKVRIDGVVGMTEINGFEGYLYGSPTPPYTTTAIIDINTNLPLDTSSFSNYISGGVIYVINTQFNSFAPPTSTQPITLTWAPTIDPDIPSTSGSYNIYKNSLSSGSFWDFGYIGSTSSYTFKDDGKTPDFTIRPPIYFNPFDSTNNYPSTVIYAQQRRFFANTNNNPSTLWGSHINSYGNFNIKIPILDTGPLSAGIPNRQAREIRFLIEIDRLIAMTDGSEIAINGNVANIVTPTEINARAQSYNGSGFLKPKFADNIGIYTQEGSSVVRDLLYDDSSNGFRGNDLTVLASHLFEGHTILDWDFMKKPHPILFAVRDDGIILVLTYDRVNGLIAWTTFSFDNAQALHVVCLPEGPVDRVYVGVKRTINGRTTKYIERLQARFFSDLTDAAFMDSRLTYDGRSDGTISVTLSGGTNWDTSELLTVTATDASFKSSDIGNQVHITGSDGTIVRITITAYTNGVIVQGYPDKTVPSSMRSVAISTWALAVDKIYGLWHLEGKAVSVFADRYVVGSPKNANYTTYTVSGGSITLDRCYGVIHVGLPFITDIETLDIDTSKSGRDPNASQLITEVSVRLYNSLGFWAGSKPPSNDSVDPLENLYEVKLWDTQNNDEQIPLNSEVQTVKVDSTYNKTGRVFIRNIDPIPLSILSIRPTGLLV